MRNRKKHQQRAATIFNNLKMAKKEANETNKVITFDLEKTLPLPFLSIDEAYTIVDSKLYTTLVDITIRKMLASLICGLSMQAIEEPKTWHRALTIF